MAQDSPPRRSVRKRVPSKKYSAQVFAGSEVLASSDEREAQEEPDFSHHQENSQHFVDDDFDIGAADDQDGDEEDDEDEDDEEDDEEGDGEKASNAAKRGSSDQLPILMPEDEPDKRKALERPDLELHKSPASRHGVWRWKDENDPNPRSRGFFGKVSKSNREKLLIDYYGESSFGPLAASMHHCVANITFPSSQGLPSDGGLAYPPGFEDGLPKRPLESVRSFFGKRIAGPTNRRPATEPVRNDERGKYLPGDPTGIRAWLGPYNNQKQLQFEFAQCLRLSAIFDGAVEETGFQGKCGWIFNTGGRVLSMSWAPTRRGSEQYLAVAVDQMPRDAESRKTPFVSSDQYCASIQVWKFQKAPSYGHFDVISAWNSEPQLAQVICTEWGTCRRLKWCPCASESPRLREEAETIGIGLLGTVWTDGYVRVLDVNIHLERNERFRHYEHSLLEAKPPQSVCTCLEWLSATDLATGCANGYVAIYSLNNRPEFHSLSRRISPSPHRPYFYHEFSETYIVDIVSAAPISPHLLASLSVSGYQKLTDLRSPATEDVLFMRSRVYATSICYSPHVQNFYTTDDQGDIVQLVSRRFYSGKKVLSLPISSSGGALVAASPLHTCILIGTPDGKVECTNPVRKQMGSRQAICWSQKWFVHEWRRTETPDFNRDHQDVGREQNGRDDPETNDRGNVTTSPPLLKPQVDCDTKDVGAVVRITEGYKAEKQGSMERRNRNQQKPTVVYHERQAVTALEWNPNIDCGSWAAAGMGSGLVRVEDVGV